MSKITLDQFIKKYEGKSVDVPWGSANNHWKGECVSLVQRYLMECYGLKGHPRGNGADWQNTILKEKIGVTTTNPVRGDIVVWGKNVAGGLGHVTIYLDNEKDFDQNQGGDRTAKVRKRHSAKILAFMHLTGDRPMEKEVKPEVKPNQDRVAQDGFFKVDLKDVNPKVENLNVRDNPNGKIVGKLQTGDEVRYDSFIKDAKHTWVSYILNGERVFVAWRENDGVKFGACRFASEPAKPTVVALKVGDKVKIKQSAITYATGHVISSWAKKQTDVIVKIDDGKVLFDKIKSWVKLNDVEKI